MIGKLLIAAVSVLLGLPNFALGSERQSLKDQILKVSYDNMTNDENRVEIRQQLNGLTAQLQAISPVVTEKMIAEFSPGNWRQVWSDERDNSPPGAPRRDLSVVYQVVNKDGWGYNFGVRTLPNGQRVTFALSVVASVSGNQQTTEITKAFFRPTGLNLGEMLGDLAMEIQTGKSKDFVERQAGHFPNGPIGARGVLTILYIDQDLKIGTAPNVYDGVSEMFVMNRSDEVKP